jgi:prepilin-type N-terminal cleavage/methylation domain-containing protein
MSAKGNTTDGFTLLEVIIAAGISLILLSAVYSVFVLQNKRFTTEETITRMQQSLRTGMASMVRDIRMTGYDPAEVNTDADPNNDFNALTFSPSQLLVKADLNGDGTITGRESITYTYDSANQLIRRDWGGGPQPFLRNVQAFSLTCLDTTGNATSIPANVRRIRLSITVHTAEHDPAYPDNYGCRITTLSALTSPRNLMK